ncbi:Lipoprotein signal peptidase [Roseovarius litorisediminis]|uniref:Lipoprotein signal peptidase n=1 Tax=Roseovarius litorisediminis TaxID=1312363 RepID=A0A1Y5RKG3_9RHOB|nr:signal peptidase II [Roseovarius litorisediminis]SLN19619.1 Lipoprotein signal peptidase [Roseovarius litorisediminis]
MRVVFWVGLATFLIDQATKYWAVHAMNLAFRGQIDLWPPYFNLRMAWNYGINFGLLAQDGPMTRWILIAVALLISGFVLWWVHRDPAGWPQKVAAGMLVGGALGNVVDRVVYGAVADFINMSCCGINNPFSFNVADIAVFAGALGMIVFTPDKKAT